MKLKERYRMLIDSGGKIFTLNYSTRDLKMMGGPFLKEGTEFQSAAGIWDNYTMKTGMDTDAWVERDAVLFKKSVEALSERLQSDSKYLQYNYSYHFKDAPNGEANKYGPKGAGEFRIDGRVGYLQTRRPGQICVEFEEKTTEGTFEIVDRLDLRGRSEIQSTWGPIKIRKRRMGTSLPEKIIGLKKFLSNAEGVVKIQHRYNTDATA